MECNPESKSAVLENGRIRIAINSKGKITSLFNKHTGTEFISTPKPTGWRVITSLGEWYEHPVYDTMNEGSVIQNENYVEVHFDSLKGLRDDILDIKLSLHFSITDDGDTIEMKAKVQNNSSETLRELFFPYISGFTGISSDSSDALALPLEMGTVLDDPLQNLPLAYEYGLRPRPGGNFFAMDFWPHYPLPYPGVACMPWMDFYNKDQGIYLGYHDKSTPTTAILARRRVNENTFQLGFSRYPFVAPGESWESGSYMLKLHKGDWHIGAKFYREFADTKLSSVTSPDWIKEAPGLHFSFHVTQYRAIMNEYDELLKKFRHNQTLGLNLPLFVFGWVKAGFDNCYPEYEADPRLGGKEKLQSVISQITAEGGKVILYTQGRLIDKCTDYYKNVGHEICLKNEFGTEYIDEYSFNWPGTIYPGKVFALACPSTEEWYEQLCRQIDIVMDLGATGILFDQIAGDPPFLCFDKSHPHSKPDMAFDTKAELLNRLQKYAESKNPDFVVMSELICDVYLQCMDLTHGMASHRDYKKPMNFWPELYRYTFPEHRVTSRGANNIAAYNQVFALGLVLEYQTRLPNLEYVERLLKLRVQLDRFFTKGTFVDADNISFTPEKLFVKAYISGTSEETAVIAVNEGSEKVLAKLSVGRNSEEWQLLCPKNDTSSSFTTPVSEALELELEPDELKIIIIR